MAATVEEAPQLNLLRRASRRLSLSRSKALHPLPESVPAVPVLPTLLSARESSPSRLPIPPRSTSKPRKGAGEFGSSTQDVVSAVEGLKSGDFVSDSIVSATSDQPTGSPDSFVVNKPALSSSATFEIDTSTGKGHPRITISTFLKTSDTMDVTSYRRPSSGISHSLLDLKSRNVSDTFVNLARRSWSSPSVSRSPSPSSRDGRNSRDGDESTTGSSVSSTSPTKSNGPEENSGKRESLPIKVGSRTPSTMGKMTKRPLSVFMKSSASEPSISVMDEPPATQKKVKDELWEAFRLLENDFQRFQSKSSVQKANVLRQSLLPFLRKYHQKPSIHISPDELDKRARCLHRWWTVLLAQLRNRNSQAIAGSDRPAYLEGISGLMSRPEWRSPPSTFAPLLQKIPSSAKSQSSSSLASTSSAYSVQKSVQHNIKVLFTRTLFDTLAFTVEKMGLRTVPPSMVAFGGKVLAYAFYFCSGVAEMLVHLWGIQAAAVKRVLLEYGVGRGSDLKNVADGIIADFPETLQSLGFTTLASTIRKLKHPAKVPIGGSQVDWYGHWTNRWCGRDSDLLFVFLKYYHILLCDYLPQDISAAARLAAPGYLLIQAHILALLDSTIHQKPTSGPQSLASTTFEDMLANTTATLPMAPRNLLRTMAENKMIVLLRDIVSDKANCSDACRELYAQSFVAMLRAAVRKTRVFDADACFTLCDLMEEVLPIFSNAEELCGASSMVDWPFWMDVVKQMSESHNNITELRLISFVYTTWDAITENEERKRIICLEWLLSKSTWERFFCHWCPMVRAYFMRLVCWRLGRYEGNGSALDLEILEILLLRLHTAYAHHQRLKGEAEASNGALPSTAPCLPAPCRRLVILRNDIVTNPHGGALLDGIIPTSVLISEASTPLPPARALANSDSRSDTSATGTTQSNDTTGSTFSRRWSQLRSAISFRSALSGTDNDSSPPTSPDSPPFRKRTSSVSSNGSPKRDRSLQPLSARQKKTTFKFSIEWMERPPFGNRDRRLGPPRLAAPAQKYIDLESKKTFEVDASGCQSYGSHWTYAGRALAEWALVVVEHENFFDRRKTEGRETDMDVETPSLGVDSARRF